MSYRFAFLFWGLALAALVTVAFPGVVLIGLFAGVLPGILLWLSPSLLVYLAAWWCARVAVLKLSTAIGFSARTDSAQQALRRAAGAMAVLIVGVPAILIPILINARLDRTVEASRAHDQEATNPIALPSVTAWISPQNLSGRKLVCDSLCQRLLYNVAVSRLVVKGDRQSSPVGAFSLERRDQCPKPPFAYSHVTFPADRPLVRGDTVQDRLSARIANGECVMESAGVLDEAPITISFQKINEGQTSSYHPWALFFSAVTAARIEIARADGQLLYRRTEVTVEPLSVPLLIGTRAGLFSTVTYVGWARERTVHSPIGPIGRDVLPDVLGNAVRVPDPPSQ